MAASPNLVKVALSGPEGDIETLWARSLGRDRYRLENSPFLVYGLSYHDLIEARPRGPGELPALVRVIEKSGHRTIRVLLEPPASESEAGQRVLRELVDMGCAVEGLDSRCIAINVPPGIELERVEDYLDETKYMWEHADPPHDELYLDD